MPDPSTKQLAAVPTYDIPLWWRWHGLQGSLRFSADGHCHLYRIHVHTDRTTLLPGGTPTTLRTLDRDENQTGSFVHYSVESALEAAEAIERGDA